MKSALAEQERVHGNGNPTDERERTSLPGRAMCLEASMVTENSQQNR